MEHIKQKDKNLSLVMSKEETGASSAQSAPTMELKEYIFEHRETGSSSPKLNEVHHLRRLEAENHRLKMAVEDLSQDKIIQAQRIKELELEKSQLKNLIAELSLGQQLFKKVF